MREHELLTACLAEIESRGWDVEGYLADHPNIPPSMQSTLRAAARLHRAPRPVPSTAFRARARANFAARVSADAARRHTRWDAIRRSAGGLLRSVAAPAAAALMLLFVAGGVRTASASALPGTPLYPAKLAAERVQLLLATTAEQQTQAHLNIATARLQEAVAEADQGNPSVVPSLIQSYQSQVDAAEAAVTRVPSATYRQRVSRTIANLGEKTKEIGSADSRSNGPHATPASAEQPVVLPSPPSSTPSPTGVTVAGDSKPRNDHSQKQRSGDSPVPPAVAQRPSANPTPPNDASIQARDPSEQLLKQLISQALSGDVNDATATSAAYVGAIRALSLDDDGVINHLRGQRAQLQQALAAAPPATQPAIQNAINAIDAVLANAPGADNRGHGQAKPHASDDGAPTTQPPTSSSTPTQAPSGGDHPGNNGSHGNGNGGGRGH